MGGSEAASDLEGAGENRFSRKEGSDISGSCPEKTDSKKNGCEKGNPGKDWRAARKEKAEGAD